MSDSLFWLRQGAGLVGTTDFLLKENKMLREIITLQDERIASLRAEIAELLKKANLVSLPAKPAIEWRH